ncbi:hypothetical protein E2C01_015455 [Portunus trituberculatus]|uniref:Uncharacterized protein n=1 Tax=Portunus trituberculatus TaxID=210409 RepID=A0A5B7DLQ0_PORTR|nr:hypothetical protein [Portunus trituberculatus]
MGGTAGPAAATPRNNVQLVTSVLVTCRALLSMGGCQMSFHRPCHHQARAAQPATGEGQVEESRSPMHRELEANKRWVAWYIYQPLPLAVTPLVLPTSSPEDSVLLQ